MVALVLVWNVGSGSGWGCGVFYSGGEEFREVDSVVSGWRSGRLTGGMGCGAEREFHRHGVSGVDERAQFLIHAKDEGRTRVWRCGVHSGVECGVVCMEVSEKRIEVAVWGMR